jgi:hypothetical protein
MRYSKQTLAATISLLLAGAAPSSWAVLNAVDPGPYLAANGFFPAWYQDTDAIALDLCLSKAESANGPLCVLLANPGIFDPAFDICFPGECAEETLPPDQTFNFPDESFWFTGDATINANGVALTYVSALEAAFGAGEPAPGDQISFARIRIRVDLPGNAPLGNYVITHPYGVEVFSVDNPGVKVINMTRDIGIGAPGDFTGALAGDIGPFLESVNGPYTATNPDTLATETFVGDPNLLEPVTGSPFGTNFVRVEGPGGFAPVETNLFAVSGKISTVVLPTPLLIERTSYSRTTASAQEDVFALAPPDASVSFVDTALATIDMTDGDENGAWFGQSPASPTLPATIEVTAVGVASDPTTEPNALVDLVTISRAEYSQATGTLTVEAASSDEVDDPTLSANGTPMALVDTGPLQSATIDGLTIPPAFVTVTSANGGTDSEPVVVLP